MVMSPTLGRVVTLVLPMVVLATAQMLKSNRQWSTVTQIATLPTDGDQETQNVTGCQANQCLARPAMEQRPDAGNYATLEMYGCFCDQECAKFGDCCSDSSWATAAPTEISCSYMAFADTHLYLVSECPALWPQDPTRSSCQSENTSLQEDPLAALPVTNLRTGRTYRNVACARCHQDTPGAVVWSALVSCSGMGWNETRDFAASLRRDEDSGWGVSTTVDGVESFTPCYFESRLPQRLKGKLHLLRGCVPAVSDCPANWIDHQTAAECGAYTARVHDRRRSNYRAEKYDHVYRNPHCALCNGVQLDRLGCGTNDGHHVPYADDSHERVWSFSILLDISDRSGSDTVGVIQTCDGARLWDPFFHKCRDVFCDTGHVLEGEVCVPKTNTSSGNSTAAAAATAESSRFRLCPKFYLSAGEFEARQDGTVYVQLYDRVYASGEFELRDGELAVCSQSSDFGKFDAALGILSLVFVVASALCLCGHLVLFCLVPKQRNLPGMNLAALCVCLLLGYICFLAAPTQEAGTGGCRALGIIMYAAFMASFLWMNVMAFDVFIALRRATTKPRVREGGRVRPFLLYSLYVLVLTAALVTAAIASDASEQASRTYRPGFGDRLCWFNRRRALLVFFAAPLILIMTTNVLLFVGSAVILRRAARLEASITCGRSQTNLKLYCRLAAITGLSWTLGLAAGWSDFPLLWHLFVVLNTLQGVFIFISFTVGHRTLSRVRRRMSRLAHWRAAGGQGGLGTDNDRGTNGSLPSQPTEESQI